MAPTGLPIGVSKSAEPTREPGLMKQPLRFLLSEDDAGRRLDAVLRSRLDLPRSALMRRVRKGDVRVDGKRVRAPQGHWKRKPRPDSHNLCTGGPLPIDQWGPTD